MLGYYSFFSNSEEQSCPVTECKLLQQDCVTDYVKGLARMGTSAPFRLYQASNLPDGYSDMICI